MWLIRALWMGVLAVLLLILGMVAQTRVSPSQVGSRITVVEWAKCAGSGVNVDGSRWDCTGLEMYRFRLEDGTVRGPYYAVPVPGATGATGEMVLDGKWTREVLP